MWNYWIYLCIVLLRMTLVFRIISIRLKFILLLIVLLILLAILRVIQLGGI